MSTRARKNLNTPEYWDGVYRTEWESGRVTAGDYYRDYGPIHDAIVELVPDGARVLDVACGAGVLCRKIAERRPASRVTGVDFSEYTIARNREADAGAVEYVCLDVRSSLRSLRGGFDVVTMCEILEHLDEPERVVADAMTLLRRGGRFVVTAPHDEGVPSPEHVREWGHDELFHLLAPYGDAITFVHFPPPWFDAWMLAHLVKQRG